MLGISKPNAFTEQAHEFEGVRQEESSSKHTIINPHVHNGRFSTNRLNMMIFMCQIIFICQMIFMCQIFICHMIFMSQMIFICQNILMCQVKSLSSVYSDNIRL